MAAERVANPMGDFDIDLATQDDLTNMLTAIIQAIKDKEGGGRINGFNDKPGGKPTPWAKQPRSQLRWHTDGAKGKAVLQLSSPLSLVSRVRL